MKEAARRGGNERYADALAPCQKSASGNGNAWCKTVDVSQYADLRFDESCQALTPPQGRAAAFPPPEPGPFALGAWG
jgi:hypothetical protein